MQTNDQNRKQTDNLERGTEKQSRKESPKPQKQSAQNQAPALRKSGGSQDSNHLIFQSVYPLEGERKTGGEKSNLTEAEKNLQETQPEVAGNDAGNSQGKIISTESAGKLPDPKEDPEFCTAITEEDAKKITDKLQEYVDHVMDTNELLIVITLGAHNKSSTRGNPTMNLKANSKLQSEPQLLQDAKEKFTQVVSLQFDPEIAEIKEEEGNIIKVKIDAAFPLRDYGKNETQVFNKIKEIIDKLRKKHNSGFILMNTITDNFYPMLSKIINEAIPKSKEMEDGYQTAYINSYFAKDEKFRVYIPLSKRVSYKKEVIGAINLGHARDIDME